MTVSVSKSFQKKKSDHYQLLFKTSHSFTD